MVAPRFTGYARGNTVQVASGRPGTYRLVANAEGTLSPLTDAFVCGNPVTYMEPLTTYSAAPPAPPSPSSSSSSVEAVPDPPSLPAVFLGRAFALRLACDSTSGTGCSGHGSCGFQDVCACEAGWNGDRECRTRAPETEDDLRYGAMPTISIGEPIPYNIMNEVEVHTSLAQRSNYQVAVSPFATPHAVLMHYASYQTL